MAGSVIAAVSTAAGALEARGAVADGIVMNTTDYWRMRRQGADTAGFWIEPSAPARDAEQRLAGAILNQQVGARITRWVIDDQVVGMAEPIEQRNDDPVTQVGRRNRVLGEDQLQVPEEAVLLRH